MTIKLRTQECKMFNCDKRHGNFCCYKCKQKCKNRCKNNPSLCGSYVKHTADYNDFLTSIKDGEIQVNAHSNKECYIKLADYEATLLQPQEIKNMIDENNLYKKQLERLNIEINK